MERTRARILEGLAYGEMEEWSQGDGAWERLAKNSPGFSSLLLRLPHIDGWGIGRQLISLGSHLPGSHDSCYLIKNTACVLSRWMSKYSWLKNHAPSLIWTDRRGWGRKQMGVHIWVKGKTDRVSFTVYWPRDTDPALWVFAAPWWT